MGGGVLLLPLLIFVLKVPAMLAVGTDALFNFGTKIPAGSMHIRSGMVKRRVLLALATGSVPGSILGVSFLGHLRTVYGSGVNGIVSTAIGILSGHRAQRYVFSTPHRRAGRATAANFEICSRHGYPRLLGSPFASGHGTQSDPAASS